MSQRSMIRNRNRELQRSIKRSRRRSKALGTGVATVVGAAALLAPAAQGASFEVTNLDDAGPGSLRDALESANAAADADTITFAPALSGQITLTDDLDIEAAVDIQGPGADVLTVSGDDNSRIFDAQAGITGAYRDPVSISGLTLTDGNPSGEGGAVYSYKSDLTLTAMVIRGNYANGTGGAIDIESSPLEIIDSRISGNSASSEGGGIYTDGVNALDIDGDTVTLRNTVLTNNYTPGAGGGMYVDNATGGNLLIVDSEISDNESGGVGGGLQLYGHKGGTTIRNSTISGNFADDDGGGVYFNSDYTHPEGLLVENSTISGNRATSNGGGVYVANAVDKPVDFLNSTVADNRSDGDGAGIYRANFDVTLSSTIVADNQYSGGDEDDLGEASAPTGSFELGFTLVESDTSGVTITATDPGTNIFGVDPQLGLLQDNGGPTETQLPQLDSPAVDAGTDNGLTTDQRGLPRRAGQPTVPDASGSDGTDIGAAELASAKPDTSVEGAHVKAKDPQKVRGQKVKIKVKAGAAEAVDLLAKGKIKAGDDTYKLRPASRHAAANSTKKLFLKPKEDSASAEIADVLDAGGKAKAKIKVLFTDGAGNEQTEKVKVALKGDDRGN